MCNVVSGPHFSGVVDLISEPLSSGDRGGVVGSASDAFELYNALQHDYTGSTAAFSTADYTTPHEATCTHTELAGPCTRATKACHAAASTSRS